MTRCTLAPVLLKYCKWTYEDSAYQIISREKSLGAPGVVIVIVMAHLEYLYSCSRPFEDLRAQMQLLALYCQK